MYVCLSATWRVVGFYVRFGARRCRCTNHPSCRYHTDDMSLLGLPYHRLLRLSRRGLVPSRFRVLLAILSLFVTVNSLLYLRINWADGRSVGSRSLPSYNYVISIDSLQREVDQYDGADTKWDLYIDSPRQFRALAGVKQRGEGAESARRRDLEHGGTPARVRYITRNVSENTERGGGVNKALLVDPRLLNAKRATVAANYGPGADANHKRSVKHAGATSRDNGFITMTTGGRERNGIRIKAESSRNLTLNFQPISKQVRHTKTIEDSLDSAGLRPKWLSEYDAAALRRLSDKPIIGFQTFNTENMVKPSLGLLVYESGLRSVLTAADVNNDDELCRDREVMCAMLFSPAEIHRVTAFHLDRVLGFNRTLPTVSRRLPGSIRRQIGLHMDVGYPVMLYDPSLYIDEELADMTKVQLSQCIREGDTNGLVKDECNNVLTEDWGAVALFDFILQIYHRLDVGCCGLDFTDRERRCGTISGTDRRAARCTGHVPAGRKSTAGQQKIGCNFRLSSEADRLVLVENIVDLQAPLSKLDYWILDGPTSFPAHAVSILKEGSLRDSLLQSLSGDKGYWDSQGGLQAIVDMISILHQRGRMFLRHIGVVVN